MEQHQAKAEATTKTLAATTTLPPPPPTTTTTTTTKSAAAATTTTKSAAAAATTTKAAAAATTTKVAAAATTTTTLPPSSPPPPQQQHHQPRTHSNQYLWRHEPRRRLLALLCEAPHPGAGDEVEVPLPGGVEEGHGALGLVVGGDAERDDLKVVQAGGHGQDLE